MNKEAMEISSIAKEALLDKKAEDVQILDLTGISNIADCFVIASGNNVNQVKAMANNVEEQLYKKGYKTLHTEGFQSATWILLDYGTVLIHLFNKEEREYYGLERIWGDAKVSE